jgi:hypothetical protein
MRAEHSIFSESIVSFGFFTRSNDGAVAQLGERRVRNAKVGSSILLGSTNSVVCNRWVVAATGREVTAGVISMGLGTSDHGSFILSR